MLHPSRKLFPAQIKALYPLVSSFPAPDPERRHGVICMRCCQQPLWGFLEARRILGAKNNRLVMILSSKYLPSSFLHLTSVWEGEGLLFRASDEEVGSAGRGMSFQPRLEKHPSQLQGPRC